MAILAALQPPEGAVEAAENQTLARAGRAFAAAEKRWQADTNNAVVAWEFGRACFDLADAATNSAQRFEVSQKGIAACRRAIELGPKLAAGYYYLGLNVGQLARAKPLSAVGMLGDIEAAWTNAIALDPKFDYAGPHRSIGILYRDAPGWPISLGNRKMALFHLEKAVELSPDYPENRLFLLETWIDWGRKDKATRSLAEVEKVMQKARAQLTGEAWATSWADWEARWKKIRDRLEFKPLTSPRGRP